MRWGVVSTAAINDLVLPAFARSERAELAAVASRDLDRARPYAAEHDIPAAYGSYGELLADETIDCVYISLPNGLHGEWTRAALKAGKHVLCEKPLTPTAQEASSLYELAEQRGRLLMEAFMYRHHPQTLQAGALVRDGAIGTPRVVRSWFHFTVQDPAVDVRYRKDLAGGALRDVGCYCVSLSNYLFEGAPAEVSSVATLAESGVDEQFAASMLYAGGGLATFDCGIQAPLHIGTAVLGTDGVLEIPTPWYPHLPPMKLLVKRGDVTQEIDAPGDDSYFLEIENFTAAASGEAAARVTPEETLRNLDTIDRLVRAATLDRPPRAMADPELTT
jgi:D-xylose 1-dehydrogenase (NADP+, D-xylono-1,5-lactone-forming)